VSTRQWREFPGRLLIAVLLIGSVACGATSQARRPSPSLLPAAPVAQRDVDFDLTNVDPTTLCFDAAVLPSGFAADGGGVVDTADAIAMSPDPTRTAQDNAGWGRVTGAYRQWTLKVADTPTKQQSLTQSSSAQATQQEQIHAEATKALYVSTLCTVDFYQHTIGAHQAFAGSHQDFGIPIIGSTQTALADPHLGAESRAYVADGAGFGGAAVTFRTGNVVVVVSVSALCEPAGCSSKDVPLGQEAVRLATVVLGTVNARLGTGASVTPTAGAP
jgi:hypothetical protein